MSEADEVECGGDAISKRHYVLIGRAARKLDQSMTAIGRNASVDKPGDFAVSINGDGDCLVITKDGGASWVGAISLEQVAHAAANTIVGSLWGEPPVSDTGRALVLARLYDRMPHDARESSLSAARYGAEALVHFRGRPPMLVVDLSDEDVARSIALLRAFDDMNTLGRWSALCRLILVGLDASRKVK